MYSTNTGSRYDIRVMQCNVLRNEKQTSHINISGW